MTFALVLFGPFLSQAMFLARVALLTTAMVTRALPDGANVPKNLLICLIGAQC